MTAIASELAEMLRHYRLAGEVVATAPLKTGHINTTHVVHTATPGGRRRYVLQLVNGNVFRNVPGLMENVARVTAHLRAKGGAAAARVLSVVPTSDGASCVRDAAGDWWRVYDFIEGAHTVDRVTTEDQAREAARAFGEFQALLADLPGPRLHETIPDFHHTPRRVAKLRVVLAEDALGRAAEVRAETNFALARADDADRLLALFAAGRLLERVTHNDTKINNVMLDDTTHRAVSVVDLDTVMPGLALYDFGELLRTSAGSTAEDDPDPTNMHVRLPLFRALAEGWIASGAAATDAERGNLAFAGKLMAYENGVRFLTDYLQGDVYFKVHHPHHNLDRCRSQFALVRSIEENVDAMARIVDECAD
ncbi:MAG: aminoglycoside phosphotransferase family protein [Opitutus sp.]|nr:aminoglycoside phosphotransferase family protein [Opitutus sp.]